MSLRQLGECVRRTLERELGQTWLVVAETARVQRGQRCTFLELIEKQGGVVVARLDGIIFGERAARIEAAFRSLAGEPLRAGMRVLLTARVRYRPEYGLQLVVEDIDPRFTVGDLARQKQETLARLRREGLLERNRAREFPLVPQRVAVISSPHSAGYEDFVHQLEGNSAGVRFAHALFAAHVQGSAAEASLVAAFARLEAYADLFDVVVLLRGGGATADLHCFDSYRVASALAVCPLPVVTGIGHERHESVCDAAACRSVKTPTAAAELLLDAVLAYAERLGRAAAALGTAQAAYLAERKGELAQLRARFAATAAGRLQSEAARLDRAAGSLARTVGEYNSARERELDRLTAACGQQLEQGLLRHGSRIELSTAELVRAIDRYFERRAQQLDRLREVVSDCDPVNVLRRGYSITYLGTGVVKSAAEVPPGSRLVTRLYSGSLVSVCEEDGTHGGHASDVRDADPGDRGDCP